MIARVHPLTGEPKDKKPVQRFSADEVALAAVNFSARRAAKLSYDAARTGSDLDGHWSHADALSPDNSNCRATRHRLMRNSRYEAGSNGYYAGIVETHCNMVVGIGPTLRMTTNSRDFNQMVEREWYAWTQAVKLRRKLWSMAYATTADGDGFIVMQTNPLGRHAVQLDLLGIEAEQVQSPYARAEQTGYVDGIRFDEFGNILYYEILKEHPGSSTYTATAAAVRVPANQVLHWFRLKRPGTHRGIPALTSTLNVGASSRRHREATIAAAETAADIAAMLTTQANAANSDEPDPVAPFTAVDFQKRMLMMAPMGWNATQMKGEHPNAEYADFHRLQISEQGRPLSQPYNLAACDSSTYSFASGKLDTLAYRAAIDVERQDCNDLVLDPLFEEWFAEWLIVRGRLSGFDAAPSHQWDWPRHPVIDEVADSQATDTRLKNGSVTHRQVFSDLGQDLEDQLVIFAEDWFGEATDETVQKARTILALRNTPADALPYVAQIFGVELPQSTPQGATADVPAEAIQG